MGKSVIMRGQISGGYYVDGVHRGYPAPGEPFDTDAETAARLIAQGMAAEPADVEAAAVDTTPRTRKA